jgi:NAD(P)-dependent dehydrogenase (short-subunit alcohol dehydrogenase family)
MNTPALAGKVALITGANRGLGLEIARAYLAAGADVALGARDEALLAREAGLLVTAHPGRRVLQRALDVRSEESCLAFVAGCIESFGHVDVLVNNAGIYGPFGSIDTIDIREWMDAIEINLLGSVMMCRAVLPHMKARGRGAIIQVSGGGATNPLANITAYAASKAAVVRFAESLALEVAGHGIDVNSIAPGALNTRLLDDVIAAGPEKVGAYFYQRSLQQREQGGVPLGKGADLAVFLATDEARGITGRLISAVWDRYSDWPEHLDELRDSDLYTLRRITGRDRGKDWGDR